MASTSLLQSTASSFHGPRALAPSNTAARFASAWAPARRVGSGALVVRAEPGKILVDKADADKVKRFKANYFEKIVPQLQEEFAYTNIHQIPKIEKVVVNSGIGDASQNAKGLDAAVNELALITGQRPVKTRAKKSIATFKLREGMPIGIAVTLRGNIMYAFLDRLINLALPRVRDFQGVNPNSFDGNGNYSLGLSEQSVFPDIPIESIGKKRGFDVCITTSAKNDKEAFKMLALMGMPFREGNEQATLVRKKKLKAHHFTSKKGGKGRQ